MDHVIAEEGLTVTEEGKQALLTLSNGDMRRVLNVLQSASMAFKVIDEEAVYLCTGNPLPSDITEILRMLLNENYQTTFDGVRTLCTTKGYALSDILKDLTELIVTMDLPPPALANLLDEMSTIEWRLAAGTSEKLQLGALVGIFLVTRHALTPSDGMDL